jgi:hypothetical protein
LCTIIFKKWKYYFSFIIFFILAIYLCINYSVIIKLPSNKLLCFKTIYFPTFTVKNVYRAKLRIFPKFKSFILNCILIKHPFFMLQKLQWNGQYIYFKIKFINNLNIYQNERKKSLEYHQLLKKRTLHLLTKRGGNLRSVGGIFICKRYPLC